MVTPMDFKFMDLAMLWACAAQKSSYFDKSEKTEKSHCCVCNLFALLTDYSSSKETSQTNSQTLEEFLWTQDTPLTTQQQLQQEGY